MKTERRHMINVRTGILTISTGKTAQLCPDSATCCFPLTSRKRQDTSPAVPAGKSRRKCLLILGTVGTVMMAIASLVYVINPLQVIGNTVLGFTENSYLYRIWQKPPVPVYVKTYIFNVTNAEEFLAGAKMKMEEIGPFVYREELEHFNVTFQANNSVSYVPRRLVYWIPEKSTNIPLTARIVVPNIPLIGFASMLANASMFSNLALVSLASYLDSKPFLNITVEEYLWGYEDSLVRLASRLFPHWIPFDSFGLLDRMFDDGENVVTMNLNMTPRVTAGGGLVTPLSIDKYNGVSGMEHWQYREGVDASHHRCNTLQGVALEGVLFPRPIAKNDSFLVYRKAFCRTLPLQFEKEAPTNRGLRAFWYTLPEDIFDNDNPENSCYCNREEGPCLPKGLSDIATCIYGIPAAVSLPHFFRSDPALLDEVEGMKPIEEDHKTVIAIQPDYGIPMNVHTRIQTNIIVKNTKYNVRTAPFNNMVIPVFWVDLGVDELPGDVLSLLSLFLQVGPVLITVLEYGFSIVGAVLASAAVSALVLISFRRKLAQGHSGRGYRSVRIVPVVKDEERS